MNIIRKSWVKIVIILIFTLSLFLLHCHVKSADISLFAHTSNISSAGLGSSPAPVLISITAEDIDALGGFPLKRSYYALLIKRLAKYNVQTIGIELLFARVDTVADYYDQIFQKEITAAGNVFLALPPESHTPVQNHASAGFHAAGYGHLNYAEEETAVIPSRLYEGGNIYPAFSVALTGNQYAREDIRVNFTRRFDAFTRYSLVEFFRLDTNSPDSLAHLKDKIVIIGVTDEKYSQKIFSHREGVVPGLALHAFAAENIMNDSAWNTSYYYLFLALGFILLLGVSIYTESAGHKRKIIYCVVSAVLLFAAGVIMMSGSVLFPLATMLITPFVLLLSDVAQSFSAWKLRFDATVSETELLKQLLSKKTSELQELERKAAAEGKNARLQDESLLAKMKDEIEKLRSSIRDEEIISPLEAGTNHLEFEGMIYRSPVMQQTVNLIKKFAPSDETVLIIGESGTGKELTAAALHKNSTRKDKPFVAVNCGALSESLLESELFGHVKGAFTGAVTDKQGRFEAADGGTIFLDEIGEISENFQLKLLRILQEGTFEKVGSSKTVRVDTRVIAATNKNPEKLVKEKKFREDLYYRINILNISLPPLRDRKEDIPYIINKLITGTGADLKISAAAVEALTAHDWPGNIRELESVIKRAAVFAKGEDKNVITLQDLPQELTKNITLNYEDIVLEALRKRKFSHSSFTETAKELGTGRTLVNEHFRGVVMHTLCSNNFDMVKTAALVALTDETEVIQKVESKIETILANIKNDVVPLKGSGFEEVKTKLQSKYKNLPKKYHEYQDSIIKKYL